MCDRFIGKGRHTPATIIPCLVLAPTVHKLLRKKIVSKQWAIVRLSAHGVRSAVIQGVAVKENIAVSCVTQSTNGHGRILTISACMACFRLKIVGTANANPKRPPGLNSQRNIATEIAFMQIPLKIAYSISC